MRISDWSSDVCSSDLSSSVWHVEVSVLHPQCCLRCRALQNPKGSSRMLSPLVFRQDRGACPEGGGEHRRALSLPQANHRARWPDRKSVVEGKGVSVR